MIDASIVLPWFFADEVDTDAVADRVNQEPAVVPRLFFLEVGDALLEAYKAGRISKEAPFAALEYLAQLSIIVESASDVLAVARLAVSNGLTTYDAAYLELAIRLNIPLLTTEKKLLRAFEAARRE